MQPCSVAPSRDERRSPRGILRDLRETALPRSALIVAVGLLAASCKKTAEDEPRAQGRTRCTLAGAPGDARPTILFGDLHSHSSNSLDSILINLPIVGGRPYGPMDSCRFARYCAQLDFWSITDHAEEQVAAQWQENLEAVRSCNDLFGGYTHDPQMVSFLGWEWTHSADLALEDQGHHNIVLKHTCIDEIPRRPLAAPASFAGIDPTQIDLYRKVVVALDPANEALYDVVFSRVTAFRAKPLCAAGTSSLDLPEDCHEIAESTEELYRRLDAWEADALVIPHGTVWGVHHPPLTSWVPFFNDEHRSLKRSGLIEVYSSHGSSERYWPWRHAARDSAGTLTCPEPTVDFEPCCWRAGEIIRGRSEDCASDPAGAACQEAIAAAKRDFLSLGKRGVTSIPSAGAGDWLDCGQCRDCFQPALSPRPERSVQAALAMTNFDDRQRPWRYVLGMIGSTDSHRAGPGAGYKELSRMSDLFGAVKTEHSLLVQHVAAMVSADIERISSFQYAGGLVAVHAQSRSREAIWEALQRRQVYATSGERIELWFDLLDGASGQRYPMGSVVALREAPTFEVRARGAFKQGFGCPRWVHEASSEQLIEELCFGECYNPTTERYRISRIELIKITPQVTPDEPLSELIRDPYEVLPCEDAAGDCVARFRDEAYAKEARPATYYVRAIQEETMQFNAATLRCTRDAAGRCAEPRVCASASPKGADSCLSADEERAWSSPIYVAP